MNVLRARKAGFCFGVALALQKLDQLIRQSHGLSVATFGEIIHNPQVLQHYSDQGVQCLIKPEEADKNMAVLIRAHGVPKSIEENLSAHAGLLQDATCPKVKNAQLNIAKATLDGAELYLYGESEHPEVSGLVSYAHGDVRIFSSVEDLCKLLNCRKPEKNVILAAQTTQDRMQFQQMKQVLAGRCGKRLAVLDTICDATRQRQEEIAMLAKKADVVVVVGGKTSGNTRRLAELARTLGTPAVLVECAEELDPGFFKNSATVALTAGASTPAWIIDAVEQWLMRCR